MKKTSAKLLAILLSLILAFSSSIGVCAADSAISDGATHVFVSLLDRLFDLIFYIFGEINLSPTIPTVEEYKATPDEYFFEGSDGIAAGDGWTLGYANTSVIPVQWRLNSEGNPDPNGYVLNDTYYFGGYFTATVDKIYDDQCVNLVVMSPGCDKNGNGVDDIFVFAALDGVGFANKDVRSVRKAALEALASKGVENSDVLGFNMNVTHAHSTVDPQGMGLDLVWPLLKNEMFMRSERSVNSELLETIIKNTAAAVVVAYDNMEEGTLAYSETACVDQSGEYKLVNDKRNQGQNIQDFFACFYFEGISGEKTILANIGMHPTKAGRNSSKVCADVPYYIGQALEDMGYNFVFIQGAQGSVGLSLNFSEEGAAWADANALTYEEWVARYGAEYSEVYFYENDGGEADYRNIRATGYTIAQLLVESLPNARAVSPSLNARMSEVAVPVDYDILYLGGVSGLMGFNPVEYPDSESGYALMVECGYVEIGDDIVLLLMPGEIFPAIVFGTPDDYTGEQSWEGSTSWTGQDWPYPALADYVRTVTGDEDKVVLAVGLCNDAIGYVIPDTDASHFSADWLADNHYEELLAPSVYAGSTITEGFMELIGE